MAVPPFPAEPPVPGPSSPTSSLSPSIPPAPADPESIDLYLLSLLPASANDPSTLRSDLREHLSSLRNQLTELINEDYEEFISLGRGLRGEKERLDGLLEPLEGIKTEVSKVKVEVEKSVVELEGGLAGREVGRSEKALLDLLSRLFVTASRAQALLPDSTANSSNGLSVSLANGLSNGGPEDKGSEERIKQVQRAAAEWRELVYLLEKCRVEQCDAADEVQPQADEIRLRLLASLSSLLTEAMRSPNEAFPPPSKANGAMDGRNTALKGIFRVYGGLEGWVEARDVIRKEIKRWCDELIVPSALSPGASLPSAEPQTPFTPLTPTTPFSKADPLATATLAVPKLDSEEPLAQLYNRLLARVSTLVPLLEESEQVAEDFDVLGIVFEEIVAGLGRRGMEEVWGIGKVAVVKKNHSLTSMFLTQLENLSPSISAVYRLRASPAYEELSRRWQLPVYFQLRWKDIVGTLEQSLSATSGAGTSAGLMYLSVPAKSSDHWRLRSSEACWKAIERCWDEDVFIAGFGGEEAGRWWRLSLQIVSRYLSHLATLLDKQNISLAGPFGSASQPGSSVNLPALSMTKSSLNSGPGRASALGTTTSRANSTAPSGTPPPASQAGDDDSIRLLASIISDLLLWETRILALAASSELRKLDEYHIQLLIPAAIVFTDPLVALLVQLSCEPLKHLRSIATQLRSQPGSSKANDVKPSFFIPSVIAPLASLFVTYPALDPYRADWTREVAEEVLRQYAEMIRGVRKTEELLRRHRKARGRGLFGFGGGGKEEDEVDDEGRLRAVCDVDLEALKRGLEEVANHHVASQAASNGPKGPAVDETPDPADVHLSVAQLEGWRETRAALEGAIE